MRAALCARFNIGWSDYLTLTLGERADLEALLTQLDREG